MSTRECRVCKTTKDINCFSTFKKNGIIYNLNKCKDCYAVDRNKLSPELKQLKVIRNQLWRNANRDKWRATKRAYRTRKLSALGIETKTREQVGKDKEYAFKQRLINRLKHLIFLWRAKLNDSYKAKIERHYKRSIDLSNVLRSRFRNPLKKSVNSRKRTKSLQSTRDGSVNAQTIYHLYKQNPNCYYCGCVLNNNNRSLDHKEPLSMGGKHILNNIVVCCSSCNSKKSNRGSNVYMNDLNCRIS